MTIITTTTTIKEIIETDAKDFPLDIEIIRDLRGINCSLWLSSYRVESLTWTKRENGELLDLKINFYSGTK